MADDLTPPAVHPAAVHPIGGGGSYEDININMGTLGGGDATPAFVGLTQGAMGWAGSQGLTQGVGSAAITNASAANMALITQFQQSTVSGFAPVAGPNPVVMQSIFSHGWRENS